MKKIENLELIIEKKVKVDSLEIFAQPIVSINALNSFQNHFEILSRFYCNNDNLIFPNKIFSGNRTPYELETLDRIIFESSFEILEKIVPILGPNYMAAINVSKPTIIRNYDFLLYIEGLMEKYPSIKPKNIQFELTEKGDECISDFLNYALDLGYNISIDDFGTENFSAQKLINAVLSKIKKEENFSRLKVKVDRSFIKNLANENSKYRKFNLAFINLALSVKEDFPEIKLVGEGIDNSISADYLKSIGFDYGQGFLWRKPEILDETYKQPIYKDMILNQN